MHNYDGNMTHDLLEIQRVNLSRDISEMDRLIQLTEYDLVRMKSSTCSQFTDDSKKEECEKGLENITLGIVSYATFKATRTMQKMCGLYETLFKMPDCTAFCKLSLKFYPEPNRQTCRTIPIEWAKECKKRVDGKKITEADMQQLEYWMDFGMANASNITEPLAGHFPLTAAISILAVTLLF